MSENNRIYPELPFEYRLVFLFCESCKNKKILPRTQKIIEKSRRGMFLEHFGKTKIVKSFRSKDHFIETREESIGMLGEAPKRIYINPLDRQKYLFKWPKKKTNGFTHGFREMATELIMNKLAIYWCWLSFQVPIK